MFRCVSLLPESGSGTISPNVVNKTYKPTSDGDNVQYSSGIISQPVTENCPERAACKLHTPSLARREQIRICAGVLQIDDSYREQISLHSLVNRDIMSQLFNGHSSCNILHSNVHSHSVN